MCALYSTIISGGRVKTANLLMRWCAQNPHPKACWLIRRPQKMNEKTLFLIQVFFRADSEFLKHFTNLLIVETQAN